MLDRFFTNLINGWIGFNFPLKGVISLLSLAHGGMSVIAGTVGNEGLLGLPLFLEADVTPGRAVVQLPGLALRMKAAEFRDRTPDNGPIQTLIHRYIQSLFNQFTQATACTRFHPPDAHYAGWLLLTRDRMKADCFPFDQEFICEALAVGRTTGQNAAGLLKRAGLISYSRSRLTIEDRAGVEDVACGCYRVESRAHDPASYLAGSALQAPRPRIGESP